MKVEKGELALHFPMLNPLNRLHLRTFGNPVVEQIAQELLLQKALLIVCQFIALPELFLVPVQFQNCHRQRTVERAILSHLRQYRL